MLANETQNHSFLKKRVLQKFRRLQRASFRPLQNVTMGTCKRDKKTQPEVYFHFLKFQGKPISYDHLCTLMVVSREKTVKLRDSVGNSQNTNYRFIAQHVLTGAPTRP